MEPATESGIRVGAQMSCVAEPIYRVLNNLQVERSGVSWYELLCRTPDRFVRGRREVTPAEWRSWYSVIGNHVRTVSRHGPEVLVSVNISTEQLMDEDIVGSLRDLAGLPVILEWTEDVIPHADRAIYQVAAERLEDLRRTAGFRLCVDDVGAGEDGLGRTTYFKEAPESIKLDGGLLHVARTGKRAQKLLAEQVSLYQRDGSKVVVEQVETQHDLTLALALGADYTQGYFFGDSHVLRL